MNDELEIRGGGVVAVDTPSLRDAASVCAALAARCDELRGDAERLSGQRTAVPETTWAPAELAFGIARDLALARDRMADVAHALRATADVYELVELEAARASALGSGDAVAEASLLIRMRMFAGAAPDAVSGALADVDAWIETRHAALTAEVAAWARLAGPLGFGLPVAAASALWGIGVLDRGRVPAHAVLAGPSPPVRVTPTPAPPAAPPASVADLAARIPRGEDQVRVERYTEADGRARFVVYVAGTQTAAPVPGEEPLDMTANVELYAGMRSASYEGVIQALRNAGAEPGDAVMAVGHSQGAAITSRLALEGEFAVDVNVTFGSPVHADLGGGPALRPGDPTSGPGSGSGTGPGSGSGVLAVTVRHADDPVVALADGGHPGVAGAPGSVVVERRVDPGPSVGDLTLAAHHMDAYAETAALIDVSEDPRIEVVRDALTGLGTAPGAVTTYRLRRPG